MSPSHNGGLPIPWCSPLPHPHCHIITSHPCSGEYSIPSPMAPPENSHHPRKLSPNLCLFAWPPKHPPPSAGLYHKCCCPQSSLIGLPRHRAIFTSFPSQACRPLGGAGAASAFLQQPGPHLEHLLCSSGKFCFPKPHPICWNLFLTSEVFPRLGPFQFLVIPSVGLGLHLSYSYYLNSLSPTGLGLVQMHLKPPVIRTHSLPPPKI